MGRFSAERQAAAAAGPAAAATANAASGDATATPAAAAGRAPRAPRGAAAAAKAPEATALPSLFLQVEGGPSIPLPVGSDLHTRACKLVDVLYPAA